MTDREKLIELLKSAYGTSLNAPHFREHELEPLADHLIANGVTVKTEPKTNADRIRAMSDEELATLLMTEHDYALCIPFCTNKPECDLDLEDIPEERCMGCMIEWLQQPAKEAAP